MNNAGPPTPEARLCWACRHYGPGDGKNVEVGHCHARPPSAHILVVNNAPITFAAWPPVKHASDWCSEWEDGAAVDQPGKHLTLVEDEAAAVTGSVTALVPRERIQDGLAAMRERFGAENVPTDEEFLGEESP